VLEFKIKSLARAVRNYARNCGANKQWVKDVDAVIRKILGERLSKPKPTADDPAGTSASQQSFDNLIDHMDKLIGLLTNEPKYIPNEVEITVATLTAKKASMIAKDNAVKAGVVPFNNAVSARNRALYTDDIGLVDVFQSAKEYSKTPYGVKTPEHKNIVKCKFVKFISIPNT
jgi:hypothetical protein